MTDAEVEDIIATFDVNGDGELQVGALPFTLRFAFQLPSPPAFHLPSPPASPPVQFEEFAVMWAPHSPEPKPSADGSSKKKRPSKDGAGEASRAPPGVMKKQGSSWKLTRSKTSSKLSSLVSTSFAKKAKQKR